MDVVTAVNLFFKMILLSPIFLLATYVSLSMMKHMIFQGIPHMSKPTVEQVEGIRDRDRDRGVNVEDSVSIMEKEPKITQDEQRVHPYMTKEKEEILREYCINTWIPMYGETHRGVGSPCERWMK